MVSCALRLVLLIGVTASMLPAHGGQYRGPGDSVPPGGPKGPGSPGPSGPSGPSTPSTGGRPVSPETTSWQSWWEFNKDPFLQLRTAVLTGPVSGSDDFYLGTRRPELRIDVLAPTPADLRDRVVPALVKLFESEQSRDIQSACLVALGKVGLDGPNIDLEKTLASAIDRDDQEVRETAVLSLGIAGRSKALPLLAGLVRDDSVGRRLVEREKVGDRTRAYAAYALGVLAWRNDDAPLKRSVHDLLLPLLDDPEMQDRDVRVAAASALGLLVPDPAAGAHKRLVWQTVDELLAWFQKDLGRGDEIVQAHAPIAIARLMGRGTTPLHDRCKERFASTLNASTRRSNPVLQSCAIALGMLAVPREQNEADAAFSNALQTHWENGHDRQTQFFAAISLGRIAGDTNRRWLLDAYERANVATERPWLALALGLVAEKAQRGGQTDEAIAELLLDDLRSRKNDDVLAALAVAVGLTGHRSAVPVILRLLEEHDSEDRLAGYLCVSLALLGDPSCRPTLSLLLERSLRRPFLLQQAAVALGRLGDKDAVNRLLVMLRNSESLAALSAIAIAIGQIGDRRSLEPLIAMTADQDITKLARAFVAAALGGVGDKDKLPWNVPLTVDCNYAASVDTLTNGMTGVLDIL